MSSFLIRAAKVKKPKFPTDDQIAAVKGIGGVPYLNQCLLKDTTYDESATLADVWLTGWKFSRSDIREVNSFVQSLGYVRDPKQYKGHTNFTHPVNGSRCQTAVEAGVVALSWF